MFLLISVLTIVMIMGGTAEAGITGSPHDFSQSMNTSPCMVCHALHNGPVGGVLFNETFSEFPAITNVYSSATRNMSITLDAASTSDARECLACHDLTSVTTRVAKNINFLPVKQLLDENPAAYINVDLSNDHPVGFVYDIAKDRDLRVPATANVQLGAGKNEMWCASCHDIHDNQYGKFLIMSNEGSALCRDCHIR